MSRTVIQTADAPAAIGPYSQAIRANDMLFLSGQIPMDPATGDIVEGDVQAQAEQVMANLKAVLSAAGLGFEHLVKTTIFLDSMDDFAAVNDVYARAFPDAPPARATVAVATLPRNVQVEIDGIAVYPT